MGTRKPPSAPEWQVSLEDIRSQNRSTLEAVEAFRSSFEQRMDRVEHESRDRDATLALAIADLRREVGANSTDLTELKRLSLRQGGDISELKELVRQHGIDITELEELGRQHSADISELKQLGRQQSTDISELKHIGQETVSDIRELRLTVQGSTVELRGLSQKVDALNRLDERVAALERRSTPPLS
jgi:chromosome segregation ATPase